MNRRQHKRLPVQWHSLVGSIVVIACLVLTLFNSSFIANAASYADKDSTVEVVAATTNSEVIEDFKNMTYGLDLDFYKIATVVDNAHYHTFDFKVVEAYRTDLSAHTDNNSILDTDSFDGASNRVGIDQEAATNWGFFANEVAELLLVTKTVEPDFTIHYGDPVYGADDPATTDVDEALKSGLYLMVPRGISLTDDKDYIGHIQGIYDAPGADTEHTLVTYADSPLTRYTFVPELISFPSYKSTVTDRSKATEEDYVYDLVGTEAVSLKLISEDRKVSFDVVKKLESYEKDKNFVEEPVTVVYSVSVLDKKDDSKILYSNVVSMEVSGSKPVNSLTFGPYPAGSKVTVTELYMGSGYHISAETPAVQSFVLDADDLTVNNATYINAYTDNKGGGSITNNFKKTTETGDNIYDGADGTHWELNPITVSQKKTGGQ